MSESDVGEDKEEEVEEVWAASAVRAIPVEEKAGVEEPSRFEKISVAVAALAGCTA